MSLTNVALEAVEVRACLVLDMDQTCPSCGSYLRQEPAVVPPGLVPHQEVKVASVAVSGGMEMALDRDLYFEAPVAGIYGYGLVDRRGRLLWYEMLQPYPRLVAKGDTVWVRREG
jgi:hypothetical protein